MFERNANDPIVAALAPGQARPLVEVLDQVLDVGVVLDGQIVLSVAGVDLVHIGLRALLASVDTATRAALRPEEGRPEEPQP
jgi:hypothetical protein